MSFFCSLGHVLPLLAHVDVVRSVTDLTHLPVFAFPVLECFHNFVAASTFGQIAILNLVMLVEAENAFAVVVVEK